MNKKILFTLLLIPIWIILYINLENLTNFIVYSLMELEQGTHLTEAIWFLIFEVPKVILLLVLIIFIVGVIRSYFSAEHTRKTLEGKPLFVSNILAAMLGTVTPFCSCSAIPLFLGFVEAGIPIGVTFSFLISAPMVNEVALVLLIGLFGWKVALIYLFTGLLIAILAGYVIEKLKLQKYVADWVFQVKTDEGNIENRNLSFEERVQIGFEEVRNIVGKIWIYIIIGIAVGAGAHGYVPEDYMATILGSESWYGVLLSIIIGVPLYSNAAGIIPIVSVLIGKGINAIHSPLTTDHH
jgi:uncharacterized membrane protein YraQ (UPF0718 family)